MNCVPANVDMTVPSLNSLRNWTCGASSEPYAAEAITHALAGVGVVVTITVVAVVVVRYTWDV